ncbi:hypothetical protein H1R20_g6769, partial [Candolleomyces eurysporus]
MASTSPFIAHLDTNYVPSSNEIRYIQSLVEERQKLVDALDKEIQVLANRREEHATFVKKHSDLLSPIRRVPNDILSFIFLTCLPLNSPTRRPTKLSNDHPAVVLSHVCQRWRQLALNTALLWTVIDIDIPSLPDAGECMFQGEMSWWERRLEAIDEMTRTWISRSANCTLTVSFSGGLPGRHFFREEALCAAASQSVSSIVDALCDVSSRWKSLYLSLTVEEELSAVTGFLRVPNNDVPLLENLAVNVAFTSGFFTQPSSRLKSVEFSSGAGLVKAASLRRLSTGRLWGSPFSLSINWAALTEISLGALFRPTDPAFPFAVLARCPNLIRCSVTFLAIHYNTTPPIPNSTGSVIARPIQFINGELSLPRLQVLEIRGSEPPLGLASRLHLPSLRQVYLSCPLRNPEQSGAIELIRKFGDNLTDVTLTSWCFTESTVTHVLEHLPNVVSLRFTADAPLSQPGPQPAVLDSVLDHLTPKSVGNAGDSVTGDVRGGCYCPNLKKFGCRINKGLGFSAAALIRFIASRRKTRSPSPGSDMIQHENEPLTPSRTDSETAQLDSVVLALPSGKPRKTMREVLEEMGVDLEGMVLITAYKTSHSDHAWLMKLQYDLDPGLIDHDDYVSIMGPFKQTLGDWIL